MFRLMRKGTVEFLEAEEISGLVAHAFCTRRTGVSTGGYESLNVGEKVGDSPEKVVENLKRIKEAFAIPENGLVMARQVHGDAILEIDDRNRLPRTFPECDGLVTSLPGVALGIKTADCVPILFFDRRLRVAGAVHAGWRGASLGIAGKMISLLQSRFSSRTEDIVALIGPAIGPCCYEVDAPVYEAFASREGSERCFSELPAKNRWMFDLARASALQLKKAGLPGSNILTADACTSCRRELFFSHRAARGAAEGRQLSFIMMKAAKEITGNKKA